MTDPIAVLDEDPFAEEVLRDPLPFQARLRAAGPVAWLPRHGFYATGRYDEAASVLSDWKLYTSARGVGTLDFARQTPWREPAVLIEADPPRHNDIRTRVARVLSAHAIEALRADFTAQAEALVDRVLVDAEIDAARDLATAYPLRVFADALGIDEDRRELMLDYGDMAFNNFGPDNATLRASMERGQASGAAAWMMARTDRRAVRPGSLGDQLHALAEDGFLTAAEAWNVMRGQLTAGVDTSIATIGHILMCLARDPAQYAALRADPALGRGAFEEAVRHAAPIQTLFRTTTRDHVLGGVPVRADHKIMVSIAAANRDDRKWPDAGRFDLRRDSSGHLGFGRGVHVCVGMHIARLEAECLLAAFVARVRTCALAGEPAFRINNTVRGLDRLRLHIVRA